MMTAVEIRKKYLDFFASKKHQIVASAPIVVKNDPTLLFTNAGMNQFKDYFLGNRKPEHTRVADTQKCLRVSGKHNDLEEVGVDTYHHTMFEMLGNWSFGDYFKKEAIAWSWELLTDVYGIPKDRLYVTVFEGDVKENLPKDEEAWNEWKKWIVEERILLGNKKDNFWEMGDTGPCGPCTEIHVDCRTDEERKLVDGKTLVNNDHPQVIEIWNNVFMQFNRKKDGSLEALPAQHVDTGMGFERLVRVIQNKTSNYDTDIFTGTIAAVEKIVGKKYSAGDDKESIAFRVLADHIRAISFTIADGQLPSNTGAGYVIRRILRRAVRYYYSYLEYKQPLLHQLLPVIAKQFENVFPELSKQLDFVSKVVKEEEDAFLKTIDIGTTLFNAKLEQNLLQVSSSFSEAYQNNIAGIVRAYGSLKEIGELQENFNSVKEMHNKLAKNTNLPNSINRVIEKSIDSVQGSLNKILESQKRILEAQKSLKKVREVLANNPDLELIENILAKNVDDSKMISGAVAFKLQDTYGFPIDLTKLMAKELGAVVNEEEFESELQKQKDRSRAAATVDTEDWVEVLPNKAVQFVGYDTTEADSKVVKYRKVSSKGKAGCQLVLDKTPFYAESGGQVGDTGLLSFDGEEVIVRDTKKENNLIIHFIDQLPVNISALASAKVDKDRRKKIAVHHSATHLMHAALRKVLGTHVAQKGSLVNEEYLRFDFSHFAKMTDEEIAAVEKIVNEKIRANIPVVIKEMKKDEAVAFGAMALFGEKYGDVVRVVIMDEKYSIELCGGTHVGSTGELGFFKITGESAVAAGVRRIEAVCGVAAETLINSAFAEISSIGALLKNPKDISKSIENLQAENTSFKKHIEALEARQLVIVRNELLAKDEIINNVTFIADIVEVPSADALKKLCFDLKNHLNDHVAVLCSNIDGKAFVAIGISDTVVATKGLDAGKIIKEHVAPLIKGGGGGQKNLATAGGTDVGNLKQVIEKVKSLLL